MLKLYCDYFFCKRTKQGEGGEWNTFGQRLWLWGWHCPQPARRGGSDLGFLLCTSQADPGSLCCLTNIPSLLLSGLGLYDSTSPFRQKWLRLKIRMPGLRVSNSEAFHKILESPKTPWPGFFAQMMNHRFLQPVVLDVLVWLIFMECFCLKMCRNHPVIFEWQIHAWFTHIRS